VGQPITSEPGFVARITPLVAALTLLLHLLTARDGYGIFRDELYYLANAEHLGFGYVDHPPMIGWVTWLTKYLFGTSLTGLRALPALAAGVTVLLVGRTARELGGGRFAQILAATLTALAPGYVAIFGYLSMNAFDVMFWAAAFLILVRVLATRDMRGWVAFGLVTGLALENKISPLFLGFGVVAGLVVTRDPEPFRSPRLWLGGALAAALALPHAIWQVAHGWPTLEFIANATRYKNAPVAPLDFLAEQVLMMNPLAAPIALAGLYGLLVSKDGRRFRALGWCVVAILVLMIVQRAKPYYFVPAYTALYAAGAWTVERATARAGRVWARGAVVAATVASGVALAPLAKPLLPIERFVAYQAALGLEPGTAELTQVGRLPQFFADRLGWQELAETVARVHRTLPAEDRARACVFGQNYGQAGAIDFYGPALGLPRAISGHNSYHLWGPRGCTGEVLLVIDEERGSLDELFEHVELGASYRCADCMPYEAEKQVWVCRGLRLPVEVLWPRLRSFI
jgi:4-amino-4-deoxy-L-arabinose transferase-like glycosyltransferase